MNKKLTVTIGIAAYNAEKNIRNILRALLSQKENRIIIKRIIVYYDAGGDKTIYFAKKIKNRKIRTIDNKVRMGFANSIKRLMEINTSDILVELNDDILIKDNYLIEKIASPFISDSKLGLVSGNPQPLKPKNFIQRAIVSSFRAYENMRIHVRNGNNEFTCDGKILAFSNSFTKKVRFPKKYSMVGNLDTYLYLFCLKRKFKYENARNAVVYYNCPSSIKDYIKWSTRNNADYHLLLGQFGEIVKKEFKKPVLLLNYYLLKEFVKNPLGSTFIFLLGIYIKHKSKSFVKFATSTWDVIGTTKTKVRNYLLA